jgi:hypothetical protein
VGKATLLPLYPLERYPVPFLLEAEWAPRPVWAGVEKHAPTGIRSPDRTARNDYAIPTHCAFSFEREISMRSIEKCEGIFGTTTGT